MQKLQRLCIDCQANRAALQAEHWLRRCREHPEKMLRTVCPPHQRKILRSRHKRCQRWRCVQPASSQKECHSSRRQPAHANVCAIHLHAAEFLGRQFVGNRNSASLTPSRRSTVASTRGTYNCVSAGRCVAISSYVCALWRDITLSTVPSPAL